MPFYIQRHSIRLSAKFPSFWIPCRRISLASIRHGLSRSSFTMYFTIINFELLRYYYSFFSHLFSNESVKLAFGLTEIFSKWDVVHFFMPGQSTNFLSLLLHNFREIFLNSFSINYLTPGSPNLRLLQQGIGQWRRRTGGKKTYHKNIYVRSRDCEMVRALASHQCGLGSISARELPEGFSPGSLPSTETKHFHIPIRPR